MADHHKVLAPGLHHPVSGGMVSDPRSTQANPDPEEGGLLVSPTFWMGGLVSLLIWISIASYFGLL